MASGGDGDSFREEREDSWIGGIYQSDEEEQELEGESKITTWCRDGVPNVWL